MIDTQVRISVHAAQRISERTNLTVDEMADIIRSGKSVVLRGNTHYYATKCGAVPVVIEHDTVVTVLDPIETRMGISLHRLRQYFGSAMYSEGFAVYGDANVVQGEPYDNGFVRGHAYEITADLAVVTWSGGNIAAVVSDQDSVDGYRTFRAHQAANGRFI